MSLLLPWGSKATESMFPTGVLQGQLCPTQRPENLAVLIMVMIDRESYFVNSEEGAKMAESLRTELFEILQKIQPDIIQSIE